MPRRTWLTHVALVVVQLAFAGGAVEGKIMMASRAAGGEEIEPFALGMARMAGAALAFQIVTRAFGLLAKVDVRDHLRLAGLSVLGIVLNQALFLLGLRLTTAFAASLLGATIPVFTAGLAVLFRQESASARTGIGLAIALSGVLWLTGVRSLDPGAIVVALNCLAYSAYLVCARKTIQRLGALTVITWMFTWGALIFAPFGARALAHGMATWTPRGWFFVAFFVAVPTILAYAVNAWALGRSSASLVTVYIYLQPLLAALLAWAQLGQGLTRSMVVATGLIFAGVAVVATRRPGAIEPRTQERGIA